MTTITITLNEKSAKGKKFVDFIKTTDYIKINKSKIKGLWPYQMKKSVKK